MRVALLAVVLLTACKPSKKGRCDDAVTHLRVVSMQARVTDDDANMIYKACMSTWTPKLYDCLMAARDDAAISACAKR